MRTKSFIAGNIALIVLFLSCQKLERLPITNDGTAPGAVSNVNVENLEGAALLTYNLPTDQDLLYVKAEYTTKEGVKREFKTSSYDNKIYLNGFANAEPYEVKLYAVDKGENASAPVNVTVNPLTPPYLKVRESIRIFPDFGGVTTFFDNPAAGDVAIVLLKNDSLGNFSPVNTYYTDLKNGLFSTRGFDSTEAKFGVYIRDRWGNRSDTLVAQLKPIFEMLLDRTKMRGLVLPGDAPLYAGNSGVNNLFNGDITFWLNYHTNAQPMPQWFSFDMGVTAKLSRLKWFMRSGDAATWYYYSLHNPRNVEIWGSNNPSPDGSWDSWTLLTTHEQIKPSGLPIGQLDQNDLAAATAGEEVMIPIDAPAVRYIRFKTLRTWSDGNYVNFMELSLWGSPQP